MYEQDKPMLLREVHWCRLPALNGHNLTVDPETGLVDQAHQPRPPLGCLDWETGSSGC